MSIPYINSNNLDINSIVNALTKTQDIKIGQIRTEQKSYELKISELGKAKSTIDELNTTFKNIDNLASTATAADLSKMLKDFTAQFNSTKQLSKSSLDMNIRILPSDIRKNINTEAFRTLGLSFDKTGNLAFDETKFNMQFSGDSAGTITQAKDAFNSLASKPEIFSKILSPTTGSIELQVERLNKKIEKLTLKTENVERQKELSTSMYLKQYTALQNILNQTNNAQNSLNQILSSINKT